MGCLPAIIFTRSKEEAKRQANILPLKIQNAKTRVSLPSVQNLEAMSLSCLMLKTHGGFNAIFPFASLKVAFHSKNRGYW
ncbi:MAG TPA: hypothetical protein ENI53_02660 [Thermoplasmatales archaeon]|nr:hypothetical protein [Thermoplasmatales archaeon]